MDTNDKLNIMKKTNTPATLRFTVETSLLSHSHSDELESHLRTHYPNLKVKRSTIGGWFTKYTNFEISGNGIELANAMEMISEWKEHAESF